MILFASSVSAAPTEDHTLLRLSSAVAKCVELQFKDFEKNKASIHKFFHELFSYTSEFTSNPVLDKLSHDNLSLLWDLQDPIINEGLGRFWVDRIFTPTVSSEHLVRWVATQPYTRVSFSELPRTITDAHVEQFSHNQNLTYLDLKNQGVSAKGAAYLAEMPSLEYLDLTFNQLRAGDAAVLGESKSLTTLILRNNRITSKSIEGFRKNRQLRNFYLTNNAVWSHGAHILATLPQLKILDISGNGLASSSLEAFSEHPGLVSLEAGNNPIDRPVVRSLAKNTQLRHLGLCFAYLVDDSYIESFAQLEQLETLELVGNAVSRVGVRTLRDRLPSTQVTAFVNEDDPSSESDDDSSIASSDSDEGFVF